MMFEQTFKNIDDILHKDAGCGSELDYVEQTSWILFLKYKETVSCRPPQAILDEMKALDEENAGILKSIAGLI
jgi:hypothetical protein